MTLRTWYPVLISRITAAIAGSVAVTTPFSTFVITNGTVTNAITVVLHLMDGLAGTQFGPQTIYNVQLLAAWTPF